jgi:hypothetical protein
MGNTLFRAMKVQFFYRAAVTKLAPSVTKYVVFIFNPTPPRNSSNFSVLKENIIGPTTGYFLNPDKVH